MPRGAHFWDQFGFWPNFFHRVWFTIFCRLAGFFWLAGRILWAFLVRVSGTISGASFWHQVAPQIQGLLFNLKFLVPVLGTRFGPQKWDPKPYSFLFQFPVTFQPNFEQSLYLTKKWEPNRSSFWALGSIPNNSSPFVVYAFWVSFGTHSEDLQRAGRRASMPEPRAKKSDYWGRCLRTCMQRHAR